MKDIDEIAADAVRDVQLRLDAGGDVGEGLVTTFTISGTHDGKGQKLSKGSAVVVRIFDGDETIVAEFDGYVGTVAFVEHRPTKGPRYTERKHTIKADEE